MGESENQYEFYEHFSKWRSKESKTRQMYEDAYTKSVDSEEIVRPVKKSNIKKSPVKNMALLLAVAAIITASAWASVKVSDIIKDNNNAEIVSTYFEEQGVADVFKEASWERINEKGEYVRGYNHHTLAFYINESENPDLTLFGVYQLISKKADNNSEVVSNMDEIVSMMSSDENGVGYDNYNDYLTKKGFVDANGIPSQNVYKTTMTKRTLAANIIANTATNNGIKQ